MASNEFERIHKNFNNKLNQQWEIWTNSLNKFHKTISYQFTDQNLFIWFFETNSKELFRLQKWSVLN